MVLNDPLANVLSNIMNSELRSKQECVLSPVNKVIKTILGIMKDNQYLGEYTEVTDSKGNILKLNLLGNINKCGVIKPNYTIKKDEYEKYEKRYLPSKNMGVIFISTSQGIMTHSEAKKKGIGGKLLAYCY